MAEMKRFDDWSVLVPKVGQVIQLQLGEHTFETAVISRTTSDQETFRIVVKDPYLEGTIILEITPKASGKSKLDGYVGRKPYWQIFPQNTGAVYQSAKLFFLD